MMHAYNKDYLSDAMENLGEAFDYAKYSQKLSLNQFMTFFINSKNSLFFENGNPKYISGMSGTELVLDVLQKSGKKVETSENRTDYDRSSEYWTGWILAYYQWRTGRSFSFIQKYLPAEEINRLFNPLHEAPEEKFLETAQNIIKLRASKSRVQELRKLAGMTQKQLSNESGVNLRTLQQYENMSKDITKASGIILASLAKALRCSIEDLLE